MALFWRVWGFREVSLGCYAFNGTARETETQNPRPKSQKTLQAPSRAHQTATLKDLNLDPKKSPKTLQPTKKTLQPLGPSSAPAPRKETEALVAEKVALKEGV